MKDKELMGTEVEQKKSAARISEDDGRDAITTQELECKKERDACYERVLQQQQKLPSYRVCRVGGMNTYDTFIEKLTHEARSELAAEQFCSQNLLKQVHELEQEEKALEYVEKSLQRSPISYHQQCLLRERVEGSGEDDQVFSPRRLETLCTYCSSDARICLSAG